MTGKRYFFVTTILFLIIIFSLSGCGSSDETPVIEVDYSQSKNSTTDDTFNKLIDNSTSSHTINEITESGETDNQQNQEESVVYNSNTSQSQQETQQETDDTDNEITNPTTSSPVNETAVRGPWDYSNGCPDTIFFDNTYISEEMVDIIQNIEVDCWDKAQNCASIAQKRSEKYKNITKTKEQWQEEAGVILVQAVLALMNNLEDSLNHGCFEIDPKTYKGNEPIAWVYRINELLNPKNPTQPKIFGRKPSDIISAMACSETGGYPFEEKNGVYSVKASSSKALGMLQLVSGWCYAPYYPDVNPPGKWGQPSWEVSTEYDWLDSSYRYGWNDYEVIPLASCDLNDPPKYEDNVYNSKNHVYHHPFMNILGGFSLVARKIQYKAVLATSTGEDPIYSSYNSFAGMDSDEPWPRFKLGEDIGPEKVFADITQPEFPECGKSL